MCKSAVVFDLDGTLLNTLDDLTTSTNYALAAFGLPSRSTAEVRSFVGNGIRNLIRLAVPAGSSEQLVEEVHATFDAHYAAHHLDATRPYEGVPQVVAHLREAHVPCCVVSNKGDYAVQPLVEHFFGGLFSVACGEREQDGIRRKPWPDTVLACLDAVGCAPERSIYVGDSEVDLQTARNAGMPCVIVTWGFRDEQLLRDNGARILVHTPAQLESVLLDMVRG
ncbi:MAG: HAD family hydrolase [Coriobacteriales bacterium]|nr:HAD family hydrolase [Coriobacteriales bacterium]